MASQLRDVRIFLPRDKSLREEQLASFREALEYMLGLPDHEALVAFDVLLPHIQEGWESEVRLLQYDCRYQEIIDSLDEYEKRMYPFLSGFRLENMRFDKEYIGDLLELMEVYPNLSRLELLNCHLYDWYMEQFSGKKVLQPCSIVISECEIFNPKSLKHLDGVFAEISLFSLKHPNFNLAERAILDNTNGYLAVGVRPILSGRPDWYRKFWAMGMWSTIQVAEFSGRYGFEDLQNLLKVLQGAREIRFSSLGAVCRQHLVEVLSHLSELQTVPLLDVSGVGLTLVQQKEVLRRIPRDRITF